MRSYGPLLLLTLLSTSCATMNESVQFGAGMGTAVGLAAVYGGHAGTGRTPTLEEAAIGAGVGTVLGVISSYLIHHEVAERRESFQADQTEMHFGDLPPSPFSVPKKYPMKKGVRE